MSFEGLLFSGTDKAPKQHPKTKTGFGRRTQGWKDGRGTAPFFYIKHAES